MPSRFHNLKADIRTFRIPTPPLFLSASASQLHTRNSNSTNNLALSAAVYIMSVLRRLHSFEPAKIRIISHSTKQLQSFLAETEGVRGIRELREFREFRAAILKLLKFSIFTNPLSHPAASAHLSLPITHYQLAPRKSDMMRLFLCEAKPSTQPQKIHSVLLFLCVAQHPSPKIRYDEIIFVRSKAFHPTPKNS